jgi:Flp pilus assembly protein TadG
MTTPLLAVLMFGLLGLAGLAMDGGQLFVARRETQSLADAAARAGAAQLDEVALRTNPDSPPQLDPTAATDAAAAYTAEVRRGATLTVLAVDANHIAVRVTSPPVSVTLLQLAGVGSTVRVQAVGAAVPETGITAPGD